MKKLGFSFTFPTQEAKIPNRISYQIKSNQIETFVFIILNENYDVELVSLSNNFLQPCLSC